MAMDSMAVQTASSLSASDHLVRCVQQDAHPQRNQRLVRGWQRSWQHKMQYLLFN
jgi:hypothetical protein